jgi:hypothetical protein
LRIAAWPGKFWKGKSMRPTWYMPKWLERFYNFLIWAVIICWMIAGTVWFWNWLMGK